MRWAAKRLLAIVTARVLMAFMDAALALNEDVSDLEKLISGSEDIRMDYRDLAFFLATHSYNGVPRDGYVELNLKGTIFKAHP